MSIVHPIPDWLIAGAGWDGSGICDGGCARIGTCGGGCTKKLILGIVEGTGFGNVNDCGVSSCLSITGLGGTLGVDTLYGIVVASAYAIGPGWKVIVFPLFKNGLKDGVMSDLRSFNIISSTKSKPTNPGIW